jgi:hypothetical protein
LAHLTAGNSSQKGTKMTTFTTEDRIMAEKDGSFTVNVEPIPFAGLVTLTEPRHKELTDEEIIATFNYFCSTKDESKLATNNHKYFEESMVLYARLILETASRKAQEK